MQTFFLLKLNFMQVITLNNHLCSRKMRVGLLSGTGDGMTESCAHTE